MTMISRNRAAEGQAPLLRLSNMRREVLLLAYLNPSCCDPVAEEEELVGGRSEPGSVTQCARQTKGHGLLHVCPLPVCMHTHTYTHPSTVEPQ